MAMFCGSTLMFGILLEKRLVPDLLDRWCQNEERERLLHYLRTNLNANDFEELRALNAKNTFFDLASIFMEFPYCLPRPIDVIAYPHDSCERWYNLFAVIGFRMGFFEGERMGKGPPEPFVNPDEEEIRLLLGKILLLDPATLSD